MKREWFGSSWQADAESNRVTLGCQWEPVWANIGTPGVGGSGRDGQPPGPVVTVGLLTPAEGAVLPWLQGTVRHG